MDESSHGTLSWRDSDLGVHDLAPFVIATVRAGAMGLLHFMAVRAFRIGRRGQVVVRAPAIFPSLGMPTLWIRHTYSSDESLNCAGILWSFTTYCYCFLNQSCLRRANGASRESAACASQRHSSVFRLAPQWGQRPRQSLRQIAFIGSARRTCSASTSARKRPS